MSIRKRSNDNELSSFELLLDTMCNTFGGIVFIALLMILLSQSIQINQEAVIHQNQASISYKYPRATIHQIDMQKKIEQVKYDLALKEQCDQIEKEIKRDQYYLASAKETIKSIEEKIEILNYQISESEKIQKKEREFRLPRLHTINKLPVFVAIRQGRFYAITNISYSITNMSSEKWGNSGRGYDSSDIFISEDKYITSIELLSGRGQIIKKGAEKSGKLQQAVLNINQAKEFINFAVYPDSFAEFNYVKEIVINKGFDYNWFIIEKQLSLIKGAGEIHVQ